MGRPLRIWIDLANSPHPLLFAPIVRLLEERHHEVLLTARDNAQTAELARERWSSTVLIGGPSPARAAAKCATLVERVFDLARWAHRARPDVAVSHNSYAQIVAARMRGIPIVTAADFEHQPANHLAFRLANRILMPEAMKGVDLRAKGATARRSVYYPGLKEELYVGDFEPDPEILKTLAPELGEGHIVVVMRTPPTRAIYHRFSNPLFTDTLTAMAREPNVQLVVLIRHPEQRAPIEDLGLRNCTVPTAALDSRSLMYAADLVVGAGGTMTREAALMGIPAVSLFGGTRPAVDCWLERQGLLRVIQRPDQLGPLRRRVTQPKPVGDLRARGARLAEMFVSVIEATAAAPKRARTPAPLRDSEAAP